MKLSFFFIIIVIFIFRFNCNCGSSVYNYNYSFPKFEGVISLLSNVNIFEKLVKKLEGL